MCCHTHVLCGCWEWEARSSGWHSKHSDPLHHPPAFGARSFPSFLLFLSSSWKLYLFTQHHIHCAKISLHLCILLIRENKWLFSYGGKWRVRSEEYSLNFPQSNSWEKENFQIFEFSYTWHILGIGPKTSNKVHVILYYFYFVDET